MEMTISEVAVALDTSVPRVTRAMKRLGLVATQELRNHRRVRVFEPSVVEALEVELGFAPNVEGYTREDLFVLAAINLSPYGFRSVHAVSCAAAISATTAAKSVDKLSQTGLIIVAPQQELLNRKVITVSVLRANRHHKEWRRLSEQIAVVKLPTSAPRSPKIVPRRFWHLFWNADPLKLPIAEHANFIATRMLLSDEPPAIAWAAINLPPASIDRTAGMRSTPPGDRQWLRNLALAMSREDRDVPQGRVPKGSPRGGQYGSARNSESTVDLSSSVLPDELVKKMPPGTSQTWLKIAPLLPTSAYLSGGTALTVHLLHRISRDLDIFLECPEELGTLWTEFQGVGECRATRHDESTINCVIDGTKVQVLEAATLKIVSPFITVGGMRVASVDDIMAMKLKVIVDRGELRDYFDIMKIEEERSIMAETGLAFFIEKYSPAQPDQYIKSIVMALGTLNDVEDDPALPVSRTVIVDYWMKRQRSILKHIAMFGG